MYILEKQEVWRVPEGVSCLFVAAPNKLQHAWFLNYQNQKCRSIFNGFFKIGYIITNAYRNEAGGVVGAISHESISYKAQ